MKHYYNTLKYQQQKLLETAALLFRYPKIYHSHPLPAAFPLVYPCKTNIDTPKKLKLQQQLT